MELRHLRYFAAVAEHGTVSRAAERLHVTQPGLSRQLRQLESELGVDLFERSAGRLSLTSAGRALVPRARDLLGQVESFRVAATFHAEGRLERLTVGAPTVTLTDVVAPFVATLAEEDPTTDVLGADGSSSADVLARGADLAIGTARPGPPYQSRPLAVLPLWAYVPPDHTWATRRRVTLTELAREPLVALPPAFTARQTLEDALAAAGTTWASLVEAANGTVAQALAAAGRGVAVVSDDPRYDLVPLLIELPGQDRLSIRLVSVWDSRHAAAPTLEVMAGRLSVYTCQRYNVPSQ